MKNSISLLILFKPIIKVKRGNKLDDKLLDAHDLLAQFRSEFYIREDIIYLDGNSLGAASKPAERYLQECLNEWKHYAIEGWTEGPNPWFFAAEKIGGLIAPLIGGKENEVIATGSISINLHQCLASFFKPTKNRYKILADDLNFPSDIYAIQSQLKLHQLSSEDCLVKVASRDGNVLLEEDIIAAMSDDIALMLLPSVLYRSGQLLDIKTLTEEAHKRGILVGWDLAHSIGALPHYLHDWDVDFAVWCNYKYLNGGPGAVGGMFVHERHLGHAPGLAGWYSSDKHKQFDMEHILTPALDAGAYQIGTPNMLSLAPLYGSLELFDKAGIENIRQKSLQQTDYLIYCIDSYLSDFDFNIVTPLEHAKRGGHISLSHPEAARIAKAMKEVGIIPDYRQPNIIRLAPIAFYTSYQDIKNAVLKIQKLMSEKTYQKFTNERSLVA